MELVLIILVSFAAALLTFFSGFGLGTILLPVFALFFPVDVAIGLTAVVHLTNNLFKIGLVWKNISYKTLLMFGLPAMVFAFLGAHVLGLLSTSPLAFHFSIFNKTFQTNLLHLIIALLLAVFAIFEMRKKLSSLSFGKKVLPVGGMLSGFFGGLSGHQGALRSMFLLKAGLSKEGFIATGISIAILIDISRISVYGSSFLFDKIFSTENERTIYFVLAACLAAFLGSFLGKKLLKKVTIRSLQLIVSVVLLVFAVLLAFGLV